jgi:chorismate mutase
MPSFDERGTEKAEMSEDRQERVFALRGAVQAERNDRESILTSTDQLLQEMIARNDLEAPRMISCILTCTDDLDAEFPAVAARELGLDEVPLLCTREIAVPGAMERVIRAMLHYYAPTDHSPAHVYLGAARGLCSDLHSAQ